MNTVNKSCLVILSRDGMDYRELTPSQIAVDIVETSIESAEDYQAATGCSDEQRYDFQIALVKELTTKYIPDTH